MKRSVKNSLIYNSDKPLFLMLVVIGVILIWVIRSWGGDNANTEITVADWAALVIAIGIITGYSVFMYVIKDTSIISIDRAADNAYYIGLIFTIASLAYSLYNMALVVSEDTVRNAVSVVSLLPDFAIALGSTMVGIIWRVMLQETRNDPKDVEQKARDTLGVAVQGLTEKTREIIVELNNLSSEISTSLRETTQKNAELIEAATHSIGSVGSEFNKCIKEISKSTEIIKTVFADESLGKIPGLIAATEKHLEEINQKLNEQDQNLDTAFGKVSSQVSSHIKKLNSFIKIIKGHSDDIETSVDITSNATTKYVDELNKASKVLQKETKKIK